MQRGTVALDLSVRPSRRQRSRPGTSLARRWWIVFVAMVLALIPVIAAASPPDPAWIRGIYDAADGDQIVTLIADQVSSHGVAGYAICPPPPLLLALHQTEPFTAQAFSVQPLTRGPPPGSCTSIAAPPLRCAGPRQPALHSPTPDCPAGGSNASATLVAASLSVRSSATPSNIPELAQAEMF